MQQGFGGDNYNVSREVPDISPVLGVEASQLDPAPQCEAAISAELTQLPPLSNGGTVYSANLSFNLRNWCALAFRASHSISECTVSKSVSQSVCTSVSQAVPGRHQRHTELLTELPPLSNGGRVHSLIPKPFIYLFYSANLSFSLCNWCAPSQARQSNDQSVRLVCSPHAVRLTVCQAVSELPPRCTTAARCTPPVSATACASGAPRLHYHCMTTHTHIRSVSQY